MEFCFNCSSRAEQFSCSRCTFKTNFLNHLRQHSQQKLEDTPLKECKNCGFSTYSALVYFKHGHIHGSVEETSLETIPLRRKRFFCELCPYETNKGPADVKRHILDKHTDPKNIPWVQCPYCPFKAKRKNNLQSHVLRVHEKTISQRFCCTECGFIAAFRCDLVKHIKRRHSTNMRTESILVKKSWYCCQQCPYRTRHENDLSKHRAASHIDSGGDLWLQCDHCSFKTYRKLNLAEHQLKMHIRPEDIEWVYCDHCSYRGVDEYALKLHQIVDHRGSGRLKGMF